MKSYIRILVIVNHALMLCFMLILSEILVPSKKNLIFHNSKSSKQTLIEVKPFF